MHVPEFEAGAELAPAYAEIALDPAVKRLLERLKYLDESVPKSASEREALHSETAEKLNEFGRLVFSKMRLVLRRRYGVGLVNQRVFSMTPEIAKKLNDVNQVSFGREFGHPPELAVACATNALVASLLLDFANLKPGVFTTYQHAIPSAKIGGTTYVLDQNLYNLRSALTVKEYLNELRFAHASKAHPLNWIARVMFPGENPSAEDFAPHLRYLGGAKASLAAIYMNHATVLDALEKRSEAILSAQRAIELNPTQAQTHSTLGMLLFKNEDLDAAERSFLTAIRLAPNEPQSRVNLGVISFIRGDYAAAETRLKKALVFSPNSYQAHLALTKILIEKNDLDSALVHARQAVKLSPDDAVAKELLNFIERAKSTARN